MSERPDSAGGQYVRRVVLPSGKQIDVVYYAPIDEPVALHLCGSCSSELVYPIEWDEVGTTHWQVTLRCPNCEWSGTGVFDQQSVDRFDDQLDRGTATIVRDLEWLARANLEDEIDRFVNALEADAIQPDDFGRAAAAD
ncbi:MAG TPA: hypothetical protein VHB30_06890 [Solirubrobacteraceae bacterium]|jgi:hypothetical protein|nr:hypothetical protein [Solirubrobacteraceae bacterium]